MKKYINYLLSFANIIVSVSAAVVLCLFISAFKSDNTINIIFSNLKWTIAIPIVGMVIGCILVGIFFYLFYNLVKNNENPINPKLVSRIKTCGLCTLANFVIPVTLSIVAILCNKQEMNIVLLSTGFGLSAFISLIIMGFVAYLNLGISFSELSREELKRISEEENNQSNIDENNNEANSNNENNKQEATGDSF